MGRISSSTTTMILIGIWTRMWHRYVTKLFRRTRGTWFFVPLPDITELPIPPQNRPPRSDRNRVQSYSTTPIYGTCGQQGSPNSPMVSSVKPNSPSSWFNKKREVQHSQPRLFNNGVFQYDWFHGQHLRHSQLIKYSSLLSRSQVPCPAGRWVCSVVVELPFSSNWRSSWSTYMQAPCHDPFWVFQQLWFTSDQILHPHWRQDLVGWWWDNRVCSVRAKLTKFLAFKMHQIDNRKQLTKQFWRMRFLIHLWLPSPTLIKNAHGNTIWVFSFHQLPIAMLFLTSFSRPNCRTWPRKRPNLSLPNLDLLAQHLLLMRCMFQGYWIAWFPSDSRSWTSVRLC